MWSRRFLILAWCVPASFFLIACGGNDERTTPNCENIEDCLTQPDGATDSPQDGGSD